MVVLRYDVEDFALNPRTGLPVLYARKLKRYDQTPLIKTLHDFLQKHNAKANFAISYTLLKSGVDFLKPLLDKKCGHIFTWHMHLKWDPVIQKDWGKSLPSCYLGYHKEEVLEKLLDLADGAFKKVFGYAPKVSLNACLSTSTALLQSLERRGYLVQGDMNLVVVPVTQLSRNGISRIGELVLRVSSQDQPTTRILFSLPQKPKRI